MGYVSYSISKTFINHFDHTKGETHEKAIQKGKAHRERVQDDRGVSGLPNVEGGEKHKRKAILFRQFTTKAKAKKPSAGAVEEDRQGDTASKGREGDILQQSEGEQADGVKPIN